MLDSSSVSIPATAVRPLQNQGHDPSVKENMARLKVVLLRGGTTILRSDASEIVGTTLSAVMGCNVSLSKTSANGKEWQ